MFKKIIGIIIALAVVVVIVTVALSPRTTGFFPGILPSPSACFITK